MFRQEIRITSRIYNIHLCMKFESEDFYPKEDILIIEVKSAGQKSAGHFCIPYKIKKYQLALYALASREREISFDKQLL